MTMVPLVAICWLPGSVGRCMFGFHYLTQALWYHILWFCLCMFGFSLFNSSFVVSPLWRLTSLTLNILLRFIYALTCAFCAWFFWIFLRFLCLDSFYCQKNTSHPYQGLQDLKTSARCAFFVIPTAIMNSKIATAPCVTISMRNRKTNNTKQA